MFILGLSSEVATSGLVQSLALLSVLLVLSLAANLAAFPVILFRKTRYGFICILSFTYIIFSMIRKLCI
jgi:hypothetical protein